MDRHGLRPRDDGGDGVAIALLSLLPGEILPPSLFIWWDKAQHALAFAVLSVLGQFAYMMERRLVLFGLMVYRALIEIAQHATGWRYGEIIVTPA